MTRITFILPCYPWFPIGGFKVIYEYANRFANRGYTVNLVHSHHLNNEKNQRFKKRLIRNISLIKDIFYKPSIKWHYIDKKINIIYVKEIIAQNVPDADFVFATSWETAEYTINYPQNKGEKMYLIQDYEIFSGAKEQVERTWKFPLKKVFIAKWLYNKGLSLGISPSQVKYIPNGIDHDKYSIYTPLKDRPKQIAMLYHPSPRKGSLYGVKSLNIVKKQFPSLKSVLFGVVSRPSTLPCWIDYVKNPSQEELVQEIYNKSSIFLCPSLFEGWGLPGIEALSCGCALISTDTGGVNDYTEHGKNALLSQPKDSKKMAENLLLLLKDEELRVSLAREGYKHVQNFNWDRSTDLLEEFMKSQQY